MPAKAPRGWNLTSLKYDKNKNQRHVVLNSPAFGWYGKFEAQPVQQGVLSYMVKTVNWPQQQTED